MSILAEMRAVSVAAIAQCTRSARQRLLGAVLPQDCLLCKAPAGNELFCSACAEAFPRLPEPACPRCALPSPHGEICGRCQRHPPHFDRLIALYPYSFPLNRMIQHLKYGHELALATWFGQKIASACANESFDLIVPMPLHPSRMAERGFNQAMEISRPLAHAKKLPIDNRCCERTRPTTPQEGLTLRQRRSNMKGAFACNRDLSGQHILLVDDVVTTGASASECARTLHLHGASRVTVVAVARTLPL